MRAALRTLLRWSLRVGGVALLLAAVGVVVWGVPWWKALTNEVTEIADAHLSYQASHPNWSFPARVWSAPAPLDLPPERLLAQARARGYAEACPPAEPGKIGRAHV